MGPFPLLHSGDGQLRGFLDLGELEALEPECEDQPETDEEDECDAPEVGVEGTDQIHS